MSKTRIGTVVDKNGDVWTGKKGADPDVVAGVGTLLMTGGLSALFTSPDDFTDHWVEVNGERHYGKPVK
jgi:hypothetical protein